MVFDSFTIRLRFLEYFQRQHHLLIPSSSVAAPDDPTLFFTNAGMNQFKEQFLGKAVPKSPRATSCQACLRAGGKHNDLELVGHSERHLTLFEMLGNFSFGSYFKREAIAFAWQVATEIFEMDGALIYPTVFEDDDEAFALWRDHVPAERISRCGKSENFWTMGSTGPCGPCSELFYDRGPTYGAAKVPAEDIDGARYLEFWNLVFMQHDLQIDGTLKPLSQPMIDTGAGLERIALIKQNAQSVFETDILRELIATVEQLSGAVYAASSKEANSHRVIADHCRSIAFAIADGIAPSNVDKGYVVRKLIRRAVRYGKHLGFTQPFLAEILPTLDRLMGASYSRLRASMPQICQVVEKEEEAFLRTLLRGERHFHSVSKDARRENRKISGEEAFTLKDTYGLPFEEIEHLALENQLRVDVHEYRAIDRVARNRAKSADATPPIPAGGSAWQSVREMLGATPFVGYETLSIRSSITSIHCEGRSVDALKAGESGLITLSMSPFFAEGGGQIGDSGEILGNSGRFCVIDCRNICEKLIAHEGMLESGTIAVGEEILARVDSSARHEASQSHTATHLLHWELQQLLKKPVRQAGSLVAKSRLRFDFQHALPLTPEQIDEVELRVNQIILEDGSITTSEIPYEEARRNPEICQLFEGKYGPTVRVVESGPTKVLCGGTHCRRLGEIGYFRIIKESGVAAGVRRLEAVMGMVAHDWVKCGEKQTRTLARQLRSSPEMLIERVQQILQKQEDLEQQLLELNRQKVTAQARELSARAKMFTCPSIPEGFCAIIERVEAVDLKLLSDELLKLRPTSVIALCQVRGLRALIALRVSNDLGSRGLSAEKLWTAFAERKFRGKSGSTLAQGAGDEAHLDDALAQLHKLLTRA